jgi:hypothetical protein
LGILEPPAEHLISAPERRRSLSLPLSAVGPLPDDVGGGPAVLTTEGAEESGVVRLHLRWLIHHPLRGELLETVGPQEESLLSRSGLLGEGLELLQEGVEVLAGLTAVGARVDGAGELMREDHLDGLLFLGAASADVGWDGSDG